MPGWLRTLLVSVAIVTVLAHVCEGSTELFADVLPSVVHAVITHHHGDDGHRSQDTDGFHAASCEALKTSTMSIGPAALHAAPLAPSGPALDRASGRRLCRPAVLAGLAPPLFLLHAALLI